MFALSSKNLAAVLAAPKEETRLHLLDAQVEMVRQAAELVKRKAQRVKAHA